MTRIAKHSPAGAISGILEPFSEQGSEGIVWCIYDPAHNKADGKRQLTGLHAIEAGDLLRIFTDESRRTVAWEGPVRFEHDSHKAPLPLTGGKVHVQRVRDCTVHGLPQDVDAETWFDYFVQERPATLIKAAPATP